MNQTEKSARIERIRELIKQLRTNHNPHHIADALELLADMVERS